MDDDPPVLIYVMGTGDDRRSPEGRLMHGGSWRAEREWPLARAEEQVLYLHGDGSLAADSPTADGGLTTFRFDPSEPVPTIGGNISSNNNLMAHGGYDQRPREDTHAAGTLLGVFESEFAVQQKQLAPGDKLVLFSDGVHPPTTGPGSLHDPLVEAVRRHRPLSVQPFADAVARDLLEESHHPEDFTLLAVEYLAP